MKKKQIDLASYVSRFLTNYLPNDRGFGHNTISAYRDTLLLLIRDFFRNHQGTAIEKLTVSHITKENIMGFLKWSQETRGWCNATSNHRLAAIKSFARYLQNERLDSIGELQAVLSIVVKKQQEKIPVWLPVDCLKLLLQQPDLAKYKERRDFVLLSLMYDSGARVSELTNITYNTLRLTNQPSVTLFGKGMKTRIAILLEAQTENLKNYINERKLDTPGHTDTPIFSTKNGNKLTRNAINAIVQKYYVRALNNSKVPMPKKFSCHGFRHSKAMHMLQSGVDLIYIRDFLGHKSVKTTEVYARIDSEHKRKALEKTYLNINPNEIPIWQNDNSLVGWLKSL